MSRCIAPRCRRPPSARLLLVLGATFLTGCPASPPPAAPPTAIRILDRLADARASDAIDLPAAARPSFVDPFERLDDARSIIHGGDWIAGAFTDSVASSSPSDTAKVTHEFIELEDGRSLALHGPALLLSALPRPPGDSIRAHLHVGGDVRGSLIELDESLTREQLEDQTWIRARVLGPTVARHVFHASGADAATAGGDRSRTFEASFEPLPTTKSLLLFAFTPDGTVRLDHLELTGSSALDQAVRQADELDHPRAARVERHADFRESLLLETPSEIALDLHLPEDQPTLTFAAACLNRTNAPQVMIEARLERRDGVGDPITGGARVAAGAPWVEVEIPLAPLAGAEVSLTLSAKNADGSATPVGVALANPVVAGNPRAESPPPADVVLVSLDTVRADRLSIYGGTRNSCPNLASLAREAAVFDAAIAPSSWTLPSHATLFTGLEPERHGAEQPTHRLPPTGIETLASWLRDAGYQTVAFTAGGFVRPTFGLAHGFERFVVGEPITFEGSDGTRRQQADNPRLEEIRDVLAAPRRRPLFLFVHTYAAHDVVAADDDLAALGLRRRDLDQIPVDFRLQMDGEARARAADRGRETLYFEQVRRLYDAAVRGADRLVGTVVEGLNAGSRLDAAHLVVFSDHGQEMYEHGRIGHGVDLWEELIWIPLVWRGPGVAASRVESVTSLVDVAPTVLDALGLPPTPGGDGRSLWPRLRGDALAERPALSQLPQLHVLRGARFKLLERSDGTRQLFDIASEAGEAMDLADSEPERVERLAGALRQRRESLRRRAIAPTDAALDEERVSELRELGYLGDR